MICDWPRLCPAIQPDGFTGALLALEGIADAAVILHGPTGCRGLHSAFSEHAFPRELIAERLNYAERFYFGQPRIPTTYLDGDDFIFGAKEKLREAIRTTLTHRPALLALVNAPGAALIGEDLQQGLTDSTATIPAIAIEMPAFSRTMAEGYQQAVLAVLEGLNLSPKPIFPGSVSLIGLSITHANWAGSLGELRRLLALCGVKVLCAPAAGSPVAEWCLLPHAACHMVVHAEYGDRIGNWLERRYSAPVITVATGAPLGFAATEAWLTQVTRAVDADPSPALIAIREQRRLVSAHLFRISGVTSALKGMTCSICADPSLALPLARFLYDYLGILPLSVETPDSEATSSAEELKSFLNDVGCADAWQVPWQAVEADLLFADGHQVGKRLAAGNEQGNIELMLPLGGHRDLVPKPLLGAEGTAYLVERILNSVSL